jgi:hypothetical protein
MPRLLATALVLLLCSCSGGGGGGGDADAAVRGALQLLEAGIDREDAQLAAQPIGSHFFLGALSIRYSDAAWQPIGNPGPDPRAVFRAYMDNAFEALANPDQRFLVERVDVTGDIAVVRVESRFDAVRIDRTPTENVTFSGTDYMVFERERGAWRLVRWDEVAPATAPVE